MRRSSLPNVVRMFSLGLVVLWSTVPACSVPRRSKDIATLEKLRDSRDLSSTDRRAFQLLAAADFLLVQSKRHWDLGDREGAARAALMGQVKMKTGIAILQGVKFVARLREISVEQAKADAELSQLEEQEEAIGEEIDLRVRLNEAKRRALQERRSFSQQLEATRKTGAVEKQRLNADLATERLHVSAADALRKAELILKAAESVDCAKYAGAKYAVAVRMLQGAHKAFDSGLWQESAAGASMAGLEGQRAIERARPQYEVAQLATNVQLRDQSLEAEASAISGVRIRQEREGDLRRLVLVAGNLFVEHGVALLSEGPQLLDLLAGLLARYPTYPVQVTGQADTRTSVAASQSLPLARANAVYWSFVKRGIDARRIFVEGAMVPSDEATRAPTSAAAADQVEITFFYYEPLRKGEPSAPAASK